MQRFVSPQHPDPLPLIGEQPSHIQARAGQAMGLLESMIGMALGSKSPVQFCDQGNLLSKALIDLLAASLLWRDRESSI